MTRWQTVVATVAAMAFFWSGPEAAGWIIRHHREACATAAPANCPPTDCAAASDEPPVVGSEGVVGQLPPASPSAPVPPPTPSVPPAPTPTPPAPTPTPTPTPTPPKLHILLLVDDGNKDTGAANKAGVALLEKALRADVAADRLGAVETLAGAALAPDRVRTRIAALGVLPQDTLACFYSGTADYDEATRAYTLAPTGADRLPRADLRDALLARRARLTILLTDAPMNRVLPDMLPPYQPPAGPVALDGLLFQNRGVVDVHAAAASQIAFPRGAEGGLFTLALVEELRHLKPDAPAVTWLSFVERVRGATDRMYVEFRKAVLLSDKVSAEDKRAYRDQVHQTPTALTPLDQVRPVAAPSGAKPTANPRLGEIVVHVPPGARVFVEDRPTTQTGPKRHFETAELLPGQAYTYVVRAELGRDGRVVSETKRVTVRAGESVDVRFEWAK